MQRQHLKILKPTMSYDESKDIGDADSEDDALLVAELKAMELLGIRDHASGELRDKLRKRGHPPSVITQVIQDLMARGWLDDARFAEHQGSILAQKGWGPRRISQKLGRHGVPREVCEATVASLHDQMGWLRCCRARMVSRFGEPKSLDPAELQRAYRHLQHRGFAPSTIRRVLFDGAGH